MMDTIERIEVFIRYFMLGMMVLANYNNTATFHSHLRKIDYLLSSDIEDEYSSGKSVQSEGSVTCAMAEGPVPDSEDDGDESIVYTGPGESVDEPESPGTPEQEPDGDQSDAISIE
jgi:hypothetical protein